MANKIPFSQQVAECTRRFAEAEISALSALFDLTSFRLMRYAVTLTRNQHDAEDAVQTVLARVAARPSLLAAADCPWSYLLKMVRNEAFSVTRRTRRMTLLSNLSDLLTPRRIDELEREDTYRAVWKALRQLPAEQSEVVVLRVWEEMTYDQIGGLLEISPNTVASRYQYALSKLANKLQSHHREVCCE